jgi:uncharacterized protein
MDHFTPLASTLGGLLIGLSASALLLCNGRVAGVSGALGNAILPEEGDRIWRLLFLAGLCAGGLVLRVVRPAAFEVGETGSLASIAIAGVLVGVGTRLGRGCTSGHGVCGIARLSRRSMVATLVFMGTAMATVFVARHVVGGVP